MNDKKIIIDILDNIELLNCEEKIIVIDELCKEISAHLFCEGEIKAMNEIDKIEKKIHKFYKKYN